MRDSRLIEQTKQRIKNQDYEAVFAHGGCFHFALRIHEQFGYPVRGIRIGFKGSNPNHVWCLRPDDGKAIDIRGVYPEDLTIRLANGGKLADACDVPLDELRSIITSKDYSRELEAQIGELAGWIINTHERFEGVPQVDDKLRANVLNDFKNRE